MTRFRKSILLFGLLALIIGAALATFVVLSLTGSLKAEPIALEFTVDDAEKVYDGEALKATSYKITGGYLIEGHTPVISFTGEQTDAGIGISGLDVKVVDEDGYDVTDEYKIKVNSGNLLVAPCGLQINLTAQDVIYDGTAIDIGNNYSVTGGNLAKGHRVSVRISDEWLNYAGKSVAGNSVDARYVELLILDGNGRDVTGNYMYTLAGKVNIVKRVLTISPVSAEKAYDGKPLVCSQFTVSSGSLAAGHYIVPKFEAADGTAATVTDVNTGKPLEIVAKAVIYDIDGDDVTDNYDLRSGVGYLTVNKGNLTITLNSLEKEYDGEPFADSADSLYTISSDMTNLLLEFNDAGYLTTLFNGITEPGNSTYTISDFRIIHGANDVTDKFNITVVPGNLKITRRKVTLTGGTNLSEEYGGSFTFANGFSLSTLVQGHKLSSVTCSAVSAIGTQRTAVLSISVLDAQGNSVNGYYDITNFSGYPVTVNVTAKNLDVSTDSVDKIYDGYPLSGGTLYYGTLANGDKLVYTPKSITNCNDSGINEPEIEIYNSDNNPVTDFYNINSSYGTITINKKQVTVYFPDNFQIEYEQNMAATSLFSYIRCNEVSAENFGCSLLDPTTINGITKGTVEFYWNGEEPSVVENYEILTGNNRFEVIRKNSTLTETKEKIYDNKPVSADDLKKEGYTLKYSNLLGVVDAGTYSTDSIYESDCECLTVTGEFTITPVTVTVTANVILTTTYNGKPFEPKTEDLVVDSSLGLSVRSYVRENEVIYASSDIQMQTFKSFDFIFTDTGVAVKSDNVKVNLSESCVYVTVNKRTLYITLDPIYGTPDTSKDLTGIVNVSNLAEGDAIDYGESGIGIIIGITENDIMLNLEMVTVKRDGFDVTSNYEFPSYVGGVIIN